MNNKIGVRFSQVAESDYVEYMLRRSLSILLSDLRSWRRELAFVSFGVESAEGSNEGEGPILPELILVLNIWQAAGFLSDLLSKRATLLMGWKPESKVVDSTRLDGPIDWPTTFANRQAGRQGFAIVEMGRFVELDQARYVTLLLSEFVIHCRVIVDRIVESMGY